MCKMVSSRRLIILAFLTIGVFANARDAAGQGLNQEYLLKASFLGIFGDFVKWSSEPGLGTAKTLKIGILGRDPFDAVSADGRRINHFDQNVAKKVLGGKKIDVQRFASPDQYEPCHILFVAPDVAKNAEELKAILAATRGAAVLLVGDTLGLAKQGITINMIVNVNTNRVQLEINPAAAQRARLALDRRLYSLPGVKIISE